MCLVAHEERRKHGTAVRIEVGAAVGDLLPAEPGRRAEKIGINLVALDESVYSVEKAIKEVAGE